MNIVKERPILFSTEMVRAILEGRKTQTRRVIKPKPWLIDPHKVEYNLWECGDGKETYLIKCPYGKPGDLLWVRETWGLYDTQPKDGPGKALLFYRASDGESYELRYQLWRPSIFMPRWASRITLKIINVRVERLQDISEEDAIKEGATFRKGEWGELDAFNYIWDSINAKRGYSWDSNPWVWVIEFKRVES